MSVVEGWVGGWGRGGQTKQKVPWAAAETVYIFAQADRLSNVAANDKRQAGALRRFHLNAALRKQHRGAMRRIVPACREGNTRTAPSRRTDSTAWR